LENKPSEKKNYGFVINFFGLLTQKNGGEQSSNFEIDKQNVFTILFTQNETLHCKLC
jgi:hypothetical protein